MNSSESRAGRLPSKTHASREELRREFSLRGQFYPTCPLVYFLAPLDKFQCRRWCSGLGFMAVVDFGTSDFETCQKYQNWANFINKSKTES